MASINKNFNTMAFPQAFKRGNNIPLDASSVWYSMEEMLNYSKTSPVSYVGELLTLVDEAQNTATAYIIADVEGNLKEVGSATIGDNKTIVLGDDGALSLKNYGVFYYKWVDKVGEVEAHHEKQVVDAEHPWIAGLEPKVASNEEGGLEIAWYQPSTTTVEGLSSTVGTLQTEVNNLKGQVGEATDTADKNTVYGKLNGLTETVESKLDKAGGTLTGDLILADGSKAASETVVDTKVAAAVASAGHLKRSIVEVLPEVAEADANTIYMVKDTSVTSGDAYKEYMLINGAFAQIGDTSVNLDPYAEKVVPAAENNIAVLGADGSLVDGGKTIAGMLGEVDTKLAGYVAHEDGKSLIADTLIAKVEGLANIKSIGDNLVLSEEGVLSGAASYVLPKASTTVLGGVMVDGATVNVDENGKISVPVASADANGLLSKEDFAKLAGMEAGAKANVVEGMLLGTDVAEVNAAKQIVAPVANETKFGVVKSNSAMNKIAVAEDGTMEVNSVGISKLVEEDGVFLVLDGGNADSSNILVNNLNVDEVSY